MIEQLATRLLTKFTNVPNATIERCREWVEDAVEFHGNSDDRALIMLLAQSIGAREIALSVSHYFTFTDGDESVDKTMLAQQYRDIANEFMTAYEQSKKVQGGANFTIVKRADR